ncbi:MAG: hypothetical protein IIT46_04980 [Lachnospiraceae bacterium]|jgi:hypothetical protein|nr:hypothetical protein [Lachnospiraceae bacterium]MCR4802809.1 hypothetical protein [Lachnospiraceae bacterium]
MNQKLEELLASARINELLRQKEAPKKKKCNTVACVFTIIGILVVIAAAVFAFMKYLSPSYLDDDFDDFDDDFDDDFYADSDFIIEDDK